MTSLSDSDESSGDLSSEWTKVDASPNEDEEAERSATETDASSGFKGVVADEATCVERHGSSGTVSSETGVSDGTTTTIGQQLFLITKEIGVIQHAAMKVCFCWPLFYGSVRIWDPVPVCDISILN